MRRDSLAILALAVTPAICLGIARFAHALLLPEMREDLGWTYAEAGWLNTSNGAGYLAGALMCAPAIARAGPSALCGWTLGLRVRAWALRGNPGDSNLNVARGLAGLGGGLAFFAGSVQSTQIAQRHSAAGACSMPGRDWE